MLSLKCVFLDTDFSLDHLGLIRVDIILTRSHSHEGRGGGNRNRPAVNTSSADQSDRFFQNGGRSGSDPGKMYHMTNYWMISGVLDNLR